VKKSTLDRYVAHDPESDSELSATGAIENLPHSGIPDTSGPNTGDRGSPLGHKKGEPEVLIPWFYFGDLVDAVIQRCFNVNIAKSADSLGAISSVELQNLLFLLSSFPIKVIGKNGFEETIEANLADVPISLELFNQWYIQNVVRSDRQNYPVLEFLRSFIADAVVGTLNKDCYDSPKFRKAWFDAHGAQCTVANINGLDPKLYEIPQLILKTAALSLPSNPKDGDPEAQNRNQLGGNPLEKIRKFTHSTHFGRYGSAIINPDMIPPSTINLARRSTSFAQSLKNSYHLNVFYLLNSDSYVNFSPAGTNKDKNITDASVRAALDTREERDKRNGVFHLYLGADRGLVKSVNFSKVSAKYLREARYQQDALNPLAQLAATYNVNLKLIGNTIFWPGQYIFINPVGFGLGQPDSCDSTSNQLGLGGYHLITEVNNFIESGKFETEVKALFEFSGDGRPSLPGATPTVSGCNKAISSAGTATKDIQEPPAGPPEPAGVKPIDAGDASAGWTAVQVKGPT